MMTFPTATSFWRLIVTTAVLILSFANAADDHDMIMTYVPLPDTTSPGGRCMDGSMAGYYIRPGVDDSLFTIFLKGGGACSTEESCIARNGTQLGSSRDWPDSMIGEKLQDGDCVKNPGFCNATAVYINYCTGDAHLGNATEATDDTWGFYFDGHANFAAIVEKLIEEEGLNAASDVLLTGSSAGAIGSLFNLDWLADRLGPEVNVKGAPVAGWYTPGSLPGDLPAIFAPSDYARFVAGGNGNAGYDAFTALNGTIPDDRTQVKGLLSSDCLADYAPNEWFACATMHHAYRYIKTPLFSIHSQYDSNQIFATQGFAPEDPDDSEIDSVKEYIAMWGEATRVSLGQIQNNETETSKDFPDGVFSTSCLSHGTSTGTMIGDQTWLPIVTDWFFELGEKAEYYRLVETCTIEEGGLELPCNADTNRCGYNPGPKPPSGVQKCAKKMVELGCVEQFGDKRECLLCSRDNKRQLKQAGCSRNMVTQICTFASNNDSV